MVDEASMPDGDWTRTKRSTPWWDDGNVILVAENRSALFRVHRSILCARSSVFQDMFTVGSGGDGEGRIENCPVVHLPDSARDLGHVLTALYDRSHCGPANESVPITGLAAFLRLGKKYDIPHLFHDARKQLEPSGNVLCSNRWESGRIGESKHISWCFFDAPIHTNANRWLECSPIFWCQFMTPIGSDPGTSVRIGARIHEYVNSI